MRKGERYSFGEKTLSKRKRNIKNRIAERMLPDAVVAAGEGRKEV